MANELFTNADVGNHVAAFIQRTTDSYMWAGSAWEAYNSAHLATYAIALADSGGGFYTADWPTAMPAGVQCRVVVRKWDNATRHENDTRLAMYDRYWNGSAVSSSTITIDPYALTTLDNFKVYMRISGGDFDSQLTQAINAATASIQSATGRNFLARDYKERHDGIWQRQLLLFQYPINSMTRLAYGRAVAFSVHYTGTAIRAEVSANLSGLRLQTFSASGVATTTTLPYATYPSLSTLLVALPAGWSYALLNDRPSYEITPSAGESAHDRDVLFYYPDADTLEYTVDLDIGRVQMSKLGNIWFQDQTVYPATFPNYSPKYRGRPIVNEFQGLLVEYNAGYPTVPADVENICHQIAQRFYHRGSRDPDMKQGGMGPFSVTFTDNTDAAYIRNILWQYIDGRAFIA